MATQPENTAATQMPSIWRRSVGLAVFFTVAGPAIGALAMATGLYLISRGDVPHDHFSFVLSTGLAIGTPFAATCGLILAVRAAFAGRVRIWEAAGAALAATLIVMGFTALFRYYFYGQIPNQDFSGLLGGLAFFAAPSFVAALTCRWLYYLLFWPREKMRRRTS